LKKIDLTIQVAESFCNSCSLCRNKNQGKRAEVAEMRREKTVSGFDICTSLDDKAVNKVKPQNKGKNLNAAG